MRLHAFALLALTVMFPAVAAAQATLNKCIDAQGGVTYTNADCRNAHKVIKVEIDPAPVPDRPQIEASKMPAAKPATTKAAPALPALGQSEATRTLQKAKPAKTPVQPPSTKKCDTLSDKLGLTLDKMDQARRKGYTLEQMNKWNEDVRELERKKQQSGCF